MFVVQGVITMVFTAFISMPLLTELVSREDGLCYRHGAPNGALSSNQHPIPPKTAKKLTPAKAA
jgi:hypothetical protein